MNKFTNIFGTLRPMLMLDANDGAGGGEGNPPAGDPPVSKALTQEDVNELVGKARKEGRSSAEKALLEKFGFEKVDDLAAVIQSAKDEEKKRMSDLEKVQTELADATKRLNELKSNAEQVEAALKGRILNSEIKMLASQSIIDKDGKTIVRPAFRTEALEDVITLIDKSLIEEGENVGEYKGIEKALAKLAKDKPYLLPANEDVKPKGTPTRNVNNQKAVEPKTQTTSTPVLRF